MRPPGHTRRAFGGMFFILLPIPSHKRFDRGYIVIFFGIHSSLHRRHILMGVDVEHTHTATWSRRRAVKKACFLGSNINTTRSPSFKEASQLYPTNLIATPHEVRPCDTSSSIEGYSSACHSLLVVVVVVKTTICFHFILVS